MGYELEQIFGNPIFDKELYQAYIKNPQNSTVKIKTQSRKWANNMKTHFTKKCIEMTNENKHVRTLIIHSISCTSEHLSQRNEIHTQTCARMVIAALFVKTKRYNNPVFINVNG